MKRHIIVPQVSLKNFINVYFVTLVLLFWMDLPEPIYENVPLPWSSKEVRNRASSVQSATEAKLPPSKVPPQQVKPVKEDIVIEKQQNEVIPMKNNGLDMSSSSNVSSQVASTSAIHSAEQSFGKYSILYKLSIQF